MASGPNHPRLRHVLAARALQFEAVIVGGSALVLLGVLHRAIDDCDVLDPEIPLAIRDAAGAFAKENGLSTDWLNAKAHDFLGIPGCLPEG